MNVATRLSPWFPFALLSAFRRRTPQDSEAPRTLGPRLSSPIGAIGGLFGGLLGIGGGAAIAPLLLLSGTLRPAQVSGTTLAAVLVISSVGTLAYASLGHVDLGLALPIALGSVDGSAIGALTARRLSMGLMLGIFILILPYFAIKEVWPALPAPAIATSTMALVLLGMATGFCSGLLGIGGASLVVPSLVAFFLIDHIAAQGIAMSVALADSLAGVAVHARSRNIDYRVLLYIAPVALVTAVMGAMLSDRLPEVVLRDVFGVFMAVVWFILVVRWLQDIRHPLAPVASRYPIETVERAFWHPANAVGKGKTA